MKNIIFLILYLAVFPVEAQKFDWHVPYVTPGTVGEQLELEFANLLNSCKISAPLRLIKPQWAWNKLGDPISSIPISLQGGTLPLDKKVLSRQEDSTGRLFLYLYTGAERKKISTLNPQQLIPGNYLQDPAELLVQGGVDAIYKQTCSSIISAAANSSAGWSVPIATASLALSSDYRNEARTILAVVRGDLRSPIASLMDAPNLGGQLFSSLLFWQWYANNMDASGIPHYYLTNLNAVSLYQFNSVSGRSDGQVAVKAGLTTPTATVSTNFTSMLKSDNSLEFVKNITYIVTPSEAQPYWGSFRQAPTPQEIVGLAAKLSAKKTASNTTISAGVENLHAQSITGIPVELCQRDLWDTDYPKSGEVNSQGTLLVARADPGVDQANGQHLPTCTFTMSFQPNSDIVKNVTLKYHLRLNRPVGTTYVLIPTDQLDLATSTSPTLVKLFLDNRFQIAEQTPVPGTAEVDYGIHWKIEYQLIEEESDSIKPINPGTSTIALHCPQNVTPSVTSDAQYNSTTKRVSLDIHSWVYPYDGRDIKTNGPAYQCTISGTLDFVMQQPASAVRIKKRPIGDNVVLFYPPPKS